MRKGNLYGTNAHCNLVDSENVLVVYSQNSIIHGLSYGQWTVEWWRWALSSNRATNPVLDPDGALADVNQPSNVFFLAGKFGDNNMEYPIRECNIQFGKSILIPVINFEANVLEYPELATDKEVLDYVSKHMDKIILKECIINDQRIPVQRVSSDPEMFCLNVNEDIEGNDRGKKVMAAAEGYWVFLQPPANGEYRVSFRGSCENGRTNSGADYRLIIS